MSIDSGHVRELIARIEDLALPPVAGEPPLDTEDGSRLDASDRTASHEDQRDPTGPVLKFGLEPRCLVWRGDRNAADRAEQRHALAIHAVADGSGAMGFSQSAQVLVVPLDQSQRVRNLAEEAGSA